MNCKFPLILFLMLSGCAVAGQQADDQLKKGIGVTTDNFSQLVLISTELSVARSVHRLIDAGFVHGFVTNYDESIIYSLSRGPALHAGSMETRAHLGSWSMTPYDQHLFLGGEYIASAELGSAVRGEEFSFPDDPVKIVRDRPVFYPFQISSEYSSVVGCFQSSPLRYGDINGDGNREIVIFLGQKLIIFSTAKNEVIFSAHYHEVDELSEDDAEYLFPGALPGQPIFVADSGTDVLVRERLPAWRSLSKLYFGSFSGEDSQDIVLWRKLFRSNRHGDDQSGFMKLGDRLVHYTMEGGRYRMKETPSLVARSWLTTNNLTWQSGFPTYSECPGAEGELIPEMHDPLLNDPDVLQ